MIRALELRVFGEPALEREHYFVMSTQHAAVLGDVSRAPVPVKFDKWCDPWADDAHEVAVVYEVWQL